MTEPAKQSNAQTRSQLWDGPIRLFHWLLVALIAFSWWSGERHEMEWHRYSGYGILGLLVFRLYWGFAGSKTARFAQFMRSPGTTFAYARDLLKGAPKATMGHNPLGGWSVIAMLLALAAMVCAGLFAVDVDGFESGPLADYVSFEQGRAAAEAHEVIFNILLALIGLHVLAILAYLVFFRRNLIGPMIHGRAKLAAPDHPPAARLTLFARAAIGVILALLTVYAVANGFRF